MTAEDERLAQANERLKFALVGVRIERIGHRLYLVATLPPKPNSPKTRPHQQRITLGVHANLAGIRYAEKEAKKVGALNDCKEFNWSPYILDPITPPQSIGDWIHLFEQEIAPNLSSITWKTDYQNVFKNLELNQPISEEKLKQVILQTKPNSRNRRRFCFALGKLAKFAGLDGNFKNLQGKYSAHCVQPRNLPSDSLIAAYFRTIKNPGWRWVYGMIAAYGLRGHEVFFLDTLALETNQSVMIVVLEGKTGSRSVFPFYPEWVEEFGLREKILPNVNGKSHSDYTFRVTNYFRRHINPPFTALDLRHCWAVRTLLMGLDISLAAQQMGHSVKVHSETYHHWINQDVHARAYQQLLTQSNRLKAPSWIT